MTNTIKLAIIDDDEIHQKIIERLVRAHPAFELVHCAYNGQEFLSKMKDVNVLPDICIVDLEMPVMNGVETTKNIAAKYPMVKIVGYTAVRKAEVKNQMLSSGAMAVLSKNEPEMLLRFLEQLVSICGLKSA